MRNDAPEFSAKATMARIMVDGLTTGERLPSLREANIQIEKLDRMTKKFVKKKFGHSALAMTERERSRKMGPDLHLISQQNKRVDALLQKVLVEYVQARLKNHAKTPPPLATNRFLRGMAKQIVVALDAKVQSVTNDLRGTISNNQLTGMFPAPKQIKS